MVDSRWCSHRSSIRITIAEGTATGLESRWLGILYCIIILFMRPPMLQGL